MTVVTFSISHMGRIANVSVSTASGDATLDTICYQPYDVFKAALRDVRSTTDLHRSVPFSVISIRTHRAHYRVSTVHKKGSARQLWVTNVERNGADSDYAEKADMLFVCTPHTETSSRAVARPPTADTIAIFVPLYAAIARPCTRLQR